MSAPASRAPSVVDTNFLSVSCGVNVRQKVSHASKHAASRNLKNRIEKDAQWKGTIYVVITENQGIDRLIWEVIIAPHVEKTLEKTESMRTCESSLRTEDGSMSATLENRSSAMMMVMRDKA
jgi:hypothetical protein|tara:strand:- start:347 stop:712 length:366 start_codon:yes stop_codon:yes gene_type:complete